MLDTGRHALSAYQVEVRYDRRRVRIVGLEGAGKMAFKEPPFYDPKGMSGGRLVVGAFTTGDASAPKGRTAVARLHLHIKGKPPKALTVRVMTAARPGGGRIQARAHLQLMENSKREM
jgi:hypothetical protein